MDQRACPDDLVRRWAASGAMALTGRADGPPLGPPAPLVPRLEEWAAPFPEDALALLGERAALAGLKRAGRVSCGGSTRLLQARDGWLAVSLPRQEDVDAVAAWLELSSPPLSAADATGGGGQGGEGPAAGASVWATVARAVAGRRRAELIERGVLVQLAVAPLAPPSATGAAGTGPTGRPRPAVLAHEVGPAAPRVRSGRRVDLSGVLVVDLSSLWAGPLCTQLLCGQGATVVKVESARRPDGTRRGPRPFFDLLNGAKRSVVLDLATREGIGRLAALLSRADVVVESARPRALEQLGIHAAEVVATGPTVWVSITGHGRDSDNATRIAFGDDAAVAGGLVAHDGPGPVFCADAVADPLTGVVAARSCLDALQRGGRVLLDVALSAVAAEFAGPPLRVPDGLVAASPRARPAGTPAPVLGGDTAAVLGGLGIGA